MHNERVESDRRLRTSEDLVSWIEECVLGDLRTLLHGIKSCTEPGAQVYPLGGGNFLLLAGCLMALEYFARIYVATGDATSRVREYAKRFLAPINPRYEDACELIWRAMRNGMIHRSWPHRVSIESDPSIALRFGIGNEPGDCHLALIPDQTVSTLGISAPQFLADLTASVRPAFVEWIVKHGGEEALNRAQPQPLDIKTNDTRGRKALTHVLSWVNDE